MNKLNSHMHNQEDMLKLLAHGADVLSQDPAPIAAYNGTLLRQVLDTGMLDQCAALMSDVASGRAEELSPADAWLHVGVVDIVGGMVGVFETTPAQTPDHQRLKDILRQTRLVVRMKLGSGDTTEEQR